MNINIVYDPRKFYEACKKQPVEAIKQINLAIGKSAKEIKDIAQKQEAPFKTYNLRQNIEVVLNNLKGAVISRAKYSYWVHEGTSPYDIWPVKKKALANVKENKFFGKHVRHPGIKANPFMVRSVEKARPRVIKYFKDAMDTMVKIITQ